MGNLFTNLFSSLFPNDKCRILMIGLDNAGKTSILYQLKLGETVRTIPTIGFNVESISYKNVDFTVWDIGGQDKIRSLWRHYYKNMNAVIFVVDSSDKERFTECADEITKLNKEPLLNGIPMLIFANKQDKDSAFNSSSIENYLEIYKINKDREIYIQECSAINCTGIYEGLEWISHVIRNNK